MEDILSIADSSAFPLIKSSDSVSASLIKLTATTTDATTGEKTGKIQYLTSEGYQDIQEYSTNAWYDFSFVLNLETQTYDLYINNQKMLNGVQLVTADGNRMSNIRYIVFQINSAGNQTSSILLDDLSVWVPATN